MIGAKSFDMSLFSVCESMRETNDETTKCGKVVFFKTMREVRHAHHPYQAVGMALFQELGWPRN